jgi:hypothetical protein
MHHGLKEGLCLRVIQGRKRDVLTEHVGCKSGELQVRKRDDYSRPIKLVTHTSATDIRACNHYKCTHLPEDCIHEP